MNYRKQQKSFGSLSSRSAFVLSKMELRSVFFAYSNVFSAFFHVFMTYTLIESSAGRLDDGLADAVSLRNTA